MRTPLDRATTAARGTIVIAEDDFATRTTLRRILERENFTVIAVENGKLACEAVRRERPDVVVLDCMMPIMNGRAALNELKANEETRSIPIMMLTTQCEVAQKVGALEAGAQDFVTKPFDARELIARIEQQMGWRSLLAVDANAAFSAERHLLLADSERRYRLLAEAMPQIIWTANSQGELSYWNRAWYTYTGMTLKETQRGGWRWVVHPGDRARCKAASLESLQTGNAYEIEFRIRRACDGMYRWHLSRSTPVRDTSNTIVEWIGSCTDIHDFKLAAETRDVLDTVPHIVSIHDDAGFVEYFNPRFSRFTGSGNGAGLGLGWGDFVHPEDAHLLDELATDRLGTGASSAREAELRIRAGDGAYRWFHSRTVVLSPTVGRARRWVSTWTDVDERKTSEAQIAQTAAKLSQLAHYDTMTSLPNRALLLERLAEAIALAQRRNSGVMVLYIDLDYFKNINDTWGHVAGDFVLAEVGRRLTATLRAGDTAARVGGDEFILVCATGERAADDAGSLAERLLGAITQPIDFEGEALVVGASIGISLYPADGADCTALIERADAAMYAAKKSGRNAYCRYGADPTQPK